MSKLILFLVRYSTLLFVIFSILSFGVLVVAKKSQLSYDFAKALPEDNETYIKFQQNKALFPQKAELVLISYKDDSFFHPSHLTKAYKFHKTLNSIPYKKYVFSPFNAVELNIDYEGSNIIPKQIFENKRGLTTEDTAFKQSLKSQKIYEQILYNKEFKTFQFIIAFDSAFINSDFRPFIVTELDKVSASFQEEIDREVHVSGLTYIREKISRKVRNNLVLLLGISTLAVFLIITFFFRSLLDALISVLLVVIATIWSFAIIVFLGYKITILNAIVPIIMVIITIPNSIFFLNEYYSLLSVIKRRRVVVVKTLKEMIPVTFFCNIIASIGFLVFTFTGSKLLVEFGLSAFLSIIMIFFSSVIILPFYLLQKRSKEIIRSSKVNFLWTRKLMLFIRVQTFKKPRATMVVTLFLIVIAIFGSLKVYEKSSITDDFSKNDEVIQGVNFFQSEFGGVIPYNIIIDTKKKRGVRRMLRHSQLLKLNKMIQEMDNLPYLSNPLSINDYLKFFNQSLYNNDANQFKVPSDLDLQFMNSFLKKISKNKETITTPFIDDVRTSFMDKESRYLNIVFRMDNINSHQFDEMKIKVRKIFDKYFGKQYDLKDTNTMIAFFEGNKVVVDSIWESVLFSVLVIGIVVFALFRNVKFLIITLVCNVIPILFTLGLMGYMQIPLKPSTVIIFSIAFGICVDFAIRFLIGLIFTQKKCSNFSSSLRLNMFHSGISIFYTAIFLVVGFMIFIFSDFLSLKYMGVLLSMTIIGSILMSLVIMPIFLERFSRK